MDLLLMCQVPVRPAAITTVALAIIVAVLIMVWGFVKTAILTIAVSACHLMALIDGPINVLQLSCNEPPLRMSGHLGRRIVSVSQR